MSCGNSQLQNEAVPIIGGVKISELNNKPSILEDDLFVFADESNESNYNINLSQLRDSILRLSNNGDIVFYNGSDYSALSIGDEYQYLTNIGGNLTWSDLPDSASDVLTTSGDIMYYDNGDYQRLGIGTSNQVLTVSDGLPTWQDKDFYEDPLSAAGDILYRSASNATTRLPVGVQDQILKVGSSGIPEWENVDIYTSPLNTVGDILYKNPSLNDDRLAIGGEGSFLTVVSGLPSWSSISFYADPLNTDGDILSRIEGETVRIGVGSEDQVLTVDNGVPAWRDLPDSDFVYPLDQSGDMLFHNFGVPSRLQIGTEGYILASISGIPQWVNPNDIFSDVRYLNDLLDVDTDPLIGHVLKYGIDDWESAYVQASEVPYNSLGFNNITGAPNVQAALESIDGLLDFDTSDFLLASNNLSDLTDVDAALVNLGISYGNANEIPFINDTADGYDFSSTFTFDTNISTGLNVNTYVTIRNLLQVTNSTGNLYMIGGTINSVSTSSYIRLFGNSGSIAGDVWFTSFNKRFLEWDRSANSLYLSGRLITDSDIFKDSNTSSLTVSGGTSASSGASIYLEGSSIGSDFALRSNGSNILYYDSGTDKTSLYASDFVVDNLSGAAQTILYASPAGELSSLANATGYLYNDGTGGLTWQTMSGSGFTVTNESNNRIITSTGPGTGNAEQYLTFDNVDLIRSSIYTGGFVTECTNSAGFTGLRLNNDLGERWVIETAGSEQGSLFGQYRNNLRIRTDSSGFGDVALFTRTSGSIYIYSFSGSDSRIITTSSSGLLSPLSTSTGYLYNDGSGNMSWQTSVGGFTVSNEADNRVITSSGLGAGNAESNLTFNGTNLSLTGSQSITGGFVMNSRSGTGNRVAYFIASGSLQDLPSASGFLSSTSGGALSWSSIDEFSVSNEANNRVITSTGSGTGNAEAGLTYTGSALSVTGTFYNSSTISSGSLSGSNIRVLSVNSSGLLTSVATGTGYLRNNGSGGLTWEEINFDVNAETNFTPTSYAVSNTSTGSISVIHFSGIRVEDVIVFSGIFTCTPTTAGNPISIAFFISGEGMDSTWYSSGVAYNNSSGDPGSLARTVSGRISIGVSGSSSGTNEIRFSGTASIPE